MKTAQKTEQKEVSPSKSGFFAFGRGRRKITTQKATPEIIAEHIAREKSFNSRHPTQSLNFVFR